MSQFELLMPKLGESIEEATITKWFIKPGDKVKDDDILLEIATDKVDSEIPSPVAGTVIKVMYQQDETVPVGSIIAVIDTSGADFQADKLFITEDKSSEKINEGSVNIPSVEEDSGSAMAEGEISGNKEDGRFYSPLVRKIAREENITLAELEKIKGSGLNGRIQKNDLLQYLLKRDKGASEPVIESQDILQEVSPVTRAEPSYEKTRIAASVNAGDEIIQMDRMRKLIAEHMVMSKRISAHVTNMLEADVTGIVLWRNRIKEEFYNREKEKITYLPIFLETVISALKDYPKINASVDGDKIILRKNINLGIAVALPSGNLIVPVIKNADQLSLLGMIKALNKVADDARKNKLSPDDITGGTFTISNFGTFRNVMGTPIINQPQVAVLGIGTVEKKPAVIETPEGDVIAIRQKMFLSLTYDHRIIDGAYGGAFLRKLADYMEAFDIKRTI
jgi:2-oxoglutarate dehydrogenase E2 component (dihydrolipoamide succinyltransferase)